jgi:hypothetical protein
MTPRNLRARGRKFLVDRSDAAQSARERECASARYDSLTRAATYRRPNESNRCDRPSETIYCGSVGRFDSAFIKRLSIQNLLEK